MDITLTVPDKKVSELKKGFLKKIPVPLDDEGSPEMTELQWIKHWIKQRVMREYRKGKIKLAEENAVIDEDIIS